MPTDRRPNLFLVGAQKSGTTSLALMLGSHPDVFMSHPKEPGYLAFGEAGYTCIDGYGRNGRAASWVVRSQADYLGLFHDASPQHRYLGEASTWYLSEPGMAERVHAFNPDARVIAILRQPADRAYSAWGHARRDGEEPIEDFTGALAAEAQREHSSHLLRYREMGRYLAPLKDYFRVFGRDRVLVALYEDLADNPDALWQRCCRFLTLDPSASRPIRDRHNRSGMPRNRVVHALLRSQRFKDAMRRLLPLRLTSRTKRIVESVNLKPMPTLDAQVRAGLTADFADEIRALAGLIDRDLDHWL